MKEGVLFIGTDNDDMVEFMRYILENGGQCVCADYDKKIIRVERGTNEQDTVELFNIDGVLGSVNVSGTGTSCEAEPTGRRELLPGDEGNVLQLGYVEDLRTR